jgi:predicted SAM-dependent methyltransferase
MTSTSNDLLSKPLPHSLNIGSGKPRGEYRSKGWLNIDTHDIPGTTKMSVFEMPNHWTNKWALVRAVHVLEHVNRNRRLEFIKQCSRVLMPNSLCRLEIEVPNFEKNVEQLYHAFQNKDYDLEHRMTTGMFGKQRYPGDQHCWGFTERTLGELFSKCFTEFKIYKDGPDGNSMHDTNRVSNHFHQEDVLLVVAYGHHKKR